MEQKQSSDSSDSECEVVKRVKSSNDEMDVLMPNACSAKTESETQKKKYSIWSDILLERQLTESLSKSVHLSANGFPRHPRRNRCENKTKMDANKMGNEHAEQKIMTVRVFQPKGDKPVNICSVNEHNRKRKFTRNNRVSVGEDVEAVVQMIVTQLKEPKVFLIRKAVCVIGCHAAIKLCSETLDVESAGGLMIANGNRRRTPGGVFLTLLRASKKITQQQKDEIFAADKQTKQKKKKSKRKIRNSGSKMEIVSNTASKESFKEVDKPSGSSDSNVITNVCLMDIIKTESDGIEVDVSANESDQRNKDGVRVKAEQG